jgi:hypothetical protein
MEQFQHVASRTRVIRYQADSRNPNRMSTWLLTARGGLSLATCFGLNLRTAGLLFYARLHPVLSFVPGISVPS